MTITNASSMTTIGIAAVLAAASMHLAQGFTVPAPSSRVRVNQQRQYVCSAALAAVAKEIEEEASTPPSSASDPHWMDFLKYDGKPTFDVVAKTQQLTSEPGYRAFDLSRIPSDYYDPEYLFRGPAVGPINREDLDATNKRIDMPKIFPDLKREPFGFAVDPENPYRVLYFERWTYTHMGDYTLNGYPITMPATNEYGKQPLMTFSVNWTPEGKIIYSCLGGAVDRFEGNTGGKTAVFGLFETMGLLKGYNFHVGNKAIGIGQKFNRLMNAALQAFSKEADIPSWWKSKARGVDVNDM
eukprot:CAMPEP_0198119656 /NCGR_PEP_ID=MMETSP1442-20131203/26540_1 /TAXON_ID= /ORGANISM="Craspedostauros australis, Strain CCMP3328" /LENGTH=297 /DNA_ID=CAMNT_0043778173 /DNA_START=19 /DNA_END=912 /DNA_ORIENTATION=+